MKHTQGEWKVSKESNFNQNVECNGVNIAQINRVNGTDGDEIELANAKLIASAPKLLEALIKANDELKSIVSILDGKITPEFAKTDLGMRLVSFFKSNAFTCEEKIEPIIKKATE